MGLVLDSSVLIAAERAGHAPRRLVSELIANYGNTEAVISVISIAELVHGIERAKNPLMRSMRENFLEQLLSEIPAQPVTAPIASRAGKIDAKLQSTGTRVPLADLLIAATALELGFSVATNSLRHFEIIPDLTVRK